MEKKLLFKNGRDLRKVISSILRNGLILVLILSSLSCKKTGGSERITISGAWALYPMVLSWIEEYAEIEPNVRFDVSAGGAGKGMTDALSGAVDLGMISREIYDSEIEKGAWFISVAKDAVAPTINISNPAYKTIMKTGITASEFAEIWLGGNDNWNAVKKSVFDNDIKINIYTRSDSCGAAGTWGAFIGGLQEEFKGVGIFGDPGLLLAVQNDIYGIGYNNINYCYDMTSGLPMDKIAVIPIDVNNNGILDDDENFYSTKKEFVKAIADKRYPSPPARELYLVSNGKPAKEAVNKFLKWILTEGQSYTADAGYLSLSSEEAAREIKKFKE